VATTTITAPPNPPSRAHQGSRARTGLLALRRARLPWWTLLGGLGGAVIVVVATYAVPVLGVAVFTIAQVVGNSLGGLAVDRAGLAPVGRLAVTRSRLVGALLGVAAVTLAQLGRPVGELVLGLVGLAVVGGLAVALQAALNARVSAAGGMAAGTAVNFAVSTPAVLAIAALAGAFAGLARIDWPAAWYLYLGGPLGVGIVLALLVGVRAVGVLRTGLAIVAGQLGGAVLLDVVRPDGPGIRLPVLAGAVLTLLAVLIAGRRAPRAPVGVDPADGALVPASRAGADPADDAVTATPPTAAEPGGAAGSAPTTGADSPAGRVAPAPPNGPDGRLGG